MRMPILGVLLLFVLTCASDLYITFLIKDRKKSEKMRSKREAMIYFIASLLCWGFLFDIVLKIERGYKSLYTLTWMLYIFLSIYVPKYLFCITALIGSIVKRIFGTRKNVFIIPGLVLGIAVFILMWLGALVFPRSINVVSQEVISSKVPEGFDGFRILQFSDAHVGIWGEDTTFISKLVNEINSQKPDVIVFTGDIVSRSSEELDPFADILGRLKAPQGVYAVLGNHDYSEYTGWHDNKLIVADRKRLQDIIARMGWKLLNNSSNHIINRGDTIDLIGVENWGEVPFSTYGDIYKAYPAFYNPDSVTNSRFKILLSHNPEYWNRVISHETDVDLTLSGHTHAMQMMIGSGNKRWSPAQYRYDQWGGMYERKNVNNDTLRLYVNIGCGEVGMPARFGAIPELTLITLRSTAEK